MLSIRFINYPEFVRYAIVVVYLILAIVRLIVYFVNSKNDWLTLQLHPGKQLMLFILKHTSYMEEQLAFASMRKLFTRS